MLLKKISLFQSVSVDVLTVEVNAHVACNNSRDKQLTALASWTLTGLSLRNKVGVFSYQNDQITTLSCIFFHKDQIYWPISSISKIFFRLWFINKRKFDLQDIDTGKKILRSTNPKDRLFFSNCFELPCVLCNIV